MRALLVELQENGLITVRMMRRPKVDRLEPPSPAPTRLRHFVWQTQLPMIANSLDEAAFSTVIDAYRSSDDLRSLMMRGPMALTGSMHPRTPRLSKRMNFLIRR